MTMRSRISSSATRTVGAGAGSWETLRTVFMAAERPPPAIVPPGRQAPRRAAAAHASSMKKVSSGPRNKPMRRRQFAAALGALPLAGQAVAPAAWAEGDEWPTRSVRVVCPFTPGGSQDNIARRLGVKLGEYLGQSFVIENRSGASGPIAADKVAKSAAAGYSVPLGNIASPAPGP